MKKGWLKQIGISLLVGVASWQTLYGAQAGQEVKLSSTKVYIGGYRVPYVLETDDAKYIPAHLFKNYTVDFQTAGGLNLFDAYEEGIDYRVSLSSSERTIYKNNHQVQTILPVGGVVGKLEDTPIKIKYDVLGEDIVPTYQLNGGLLLSLEGIMTMYDAKPVIDETTHIIYINMPEGTSPSDYTAMSDPLYPVIQKLVKPDMTQREILKAFHDEVVLHVSYGVKENNNPRDAIDTYGAKIGVCEGYAKLFKQLCDRVFITCELVVGSANGEGHMWNKVYIDGEWLYVDCTHDDPIGNKNTKKEQVPQTYFLKPAAYMYNTHYWEGEDYVLPFYDASWQQIDGNKIESEESYRRYVVEQLHNQKKKFSLKTTKWIRTGLSFLTYYQQDPGADLKWHSIRMEYNPKTKSYDFIAEYY